MLQIKEKEILLTCFKILPLLILLLFISGCGSSSEDETVNIASSIKVLSEPDPVKSYNKVIIAYELVTCDFRNNGMELTRLDTFMDNGILLASYTGKELSDRILFPEYPLPDEGVLGFIGNPVQPTILLWFTVNENEIPKILRHNLYFRKNQSPMNLEFVIPSPSISVKSYNPAVLFPPVKGDRWFAHATASNDNHHRKGLITIKSVTRVPQRFAVDFLKVDGNGYFINGDINKNESFPCYGEDLFAVADGVVVDTKDGIEDNIPFQLPDITIENATGNYVTLDIGNGRYAFYCHCKPGSINVRTGDRVSKGTFLGKIGNTGNSDAPHLHFQIGDNEKLLSSDGLPYVFNSFNIQGYADITAFYVYGTPYSPDERPDARLMEMLPLKSVISF